MLAILLLYNLVFAILMLYNLVFSCSEVEKVGLRKKFIMHEILVSCKGLLALCILSLPKFREFVTIDCLRISNAEIFGENFMQLEHHQFLARIPDLNYPFY